MASFALEDFVGNGVLKSQLDNLLADGWDDVPTLKMMTYQDMDTLELSQLQRDAIEIRRHLHDRNLMEYGDALEGSGKTLRELLAMSDAELANETHMKRGHIARFKDRGSACVEPPVVLPRNLTLPARQTTMKHHSGILKQQHNVQQMQQSSLDDSKLFDSTTFDGPAPPPAGSDKGHVKIIEPSGDLDSLYPGMKIKSNYNGDTTTMMDHSGFQMPKVIRPVGSQAVYSTTPESTRCFGLVKSKVGKEEVTSLEVLERIMIQKVTSAHTRGNNPFKNKSGPIRLPKPTRASELWAEVPTVILCLRRPGCVMCRAEAHQLYARKPIFDAMGVQLVVCLNEHNDAEIRAFWPRFWGGIVVVDEKKDFFKALGGGEVLHEGLITGLLFNPIARNNRKRARASGIVGNPVGDATIKGGLFIVRPGRGGVAYQFVERNFGDWAPLEEVLNVCSELPRPPPPPRGTESY